tara:strand:- start:581 stop:943 length:363 start_codon:yes stop_codon:yes gene_type:complete
MITINFAGNINNSSLQLGDLAYYITPSNVGGFVTSLDSSGDYEKPTLIGKIDTIASDSIIVDPSMGDGTPSDGDFIMFAKDSRVNLSGIVGYYAEVEIKNNSDKKAEMYSIASEVTPSSK